jgi:hypothetical protein
MKFDLIEGKLHSGNFLGFYLSPCQQLDHELLGFEKYMVLQRDDGNTTYYKIVVPCGTVVRNKGKVTISPEAEEDAEEEAKKLRFHTYDVHTRLKSLEASCVEARLQLAALYAATSSLLPENGSQKTGAERAVELIRQSWVNRPLGKCESTHMHSIADFDQHAPSLSLLCAGIIHSSEELSFLHGIKIKKRPHFDNHLSDAATDYVQQKQQQRLNGRVVLNSHEETVSLGFETAEKHSGRELPNFGNLDVLELPASCEHKISTVEKHLESLRVYSDGKDAEFPFKSTIKTSTLGLKWTKGGPAMPKTGTEIHNVALASALQHQLEFSRDEWDIFKVDKIYNDSYIKSGSLYFKPAASMGSHFLQDLSKSWDAYTHLKTVGLADILDNNLHDGLEEDFTMIKDERERVEEGLLKIITFVPTTANIPSPSADSTAGTTSFSTQVSWHVIAFRLKRTINQVPIPTVQDLARLSFMPKMLKDFNPFLSEAGTKKFQTGVFQWLDLCVLEDKLHRMLGFARKKEQQPLERELENIKSDWSVQDYPEWRVFEMEQQLQIRNVQFDVARHLMSNPGILNASLSLFILASPYSSVRVI